jgi:YggT family protein
MSLIQIIQFIFQLISIVIIVDVLLSFFMSPFHPVRSFLDRIVDPLLYPIRKVVPPIMNMDFSPGSYIIFRQLLESWITQVI